jgi:carbon monoxide dehydrogenase subunit G
MSGFEMSEWIACPPKRIFEFITDSNNAPRIVPSVKSSIKLTDGPIKVGTRYRETRLMHGKEQSAELEVSEYAEPNVYAMRNVTSGIETVYRYTLKPEKDGTRINLVCEVKAAGIKKLMLPVVALILKKEDGAHLQRLKQVLEERMTV